MSDLFAALAAWITNVVQTGGYPGVAFLTLLENLFPPIPSELILPVAGFLARRGQFEFGWVVVASTLGSLAGALALYWLGYQLGEARLREFVKRHGRWLALEESDVQQAQEWLERHGNQAVLLGRLVPTVRSVISIPAGVARMPLLPFVGYTTLGSAVWNTVLTAAGWFLGDRWELIQPYLDALEWAGLGLLAAGIVVFVWRRNGKRKRPAQDDRDARTLRSRATGPGA